MIRKYKNLNLADHREILHTRSQEYKKGHRVLSFKKLLIMKNRKINFNFT